MKSFILSGKLVVIACLFLACGCTETSKKQESASTKPPALRIKVEPCDEGSGETVRIHKFNADNVEVETEIVYDPNTGLGSKILYWDENSGRLKEQKILLKNSSVVLGHVKLSTDGKSIVWQESYDFDGKRNFSMARLADGRFHSRFYRGGEVYSELFELFSLNRNGSGQYEMKNGEQTTKQSWNAAGEISEEQFVEGKLRRRSELKLDGSLTSTIYREDGTEHYRQHFRFPELRAEAAEYYRRFAPQSSPLFVEKVELFAADGKTPLKTAFYSIFNGPYELQVQSEDGSFKVYSLKNILDTGLIVVKIYDKNKVLIKEDLNRAHTVLLLLNDISSVKNTNLSPFSLDNLKRRFRLEE